MLLGHALSESNADDAATLFELVMNRQPMIPVRYGNAGVSLDSLAVWAGSDARILDCIRYRRLDEAANDDALSTEVLAAHISGKQQLLCQHIERNLHDGEPGAVARALMVAGFSDENLYNRDVLRRHDGTDGFVGEACSAAKYAYDRNLWSRHWFGRMCQENDPLEFWRCSVLFLKIVDGRYDIWGRSTEIRVTSCACSGLICGTLLTAESRSGGRSENDKQSIRAGPASSGKAVVTAIAGVRSDRLD